MTHRQLLKSTHTFQKQESSGIGVVCRRSEHDAHRTNNEQRPSAPHHHQASKGSVHQLTWVCVGIQRLNNAAHHFVKMTVLKHHHDDWPATEATGPPQRHGQSRFVAVTRGGKHERLLEGPPATLFISSWPPSRHSRACMCVWVQGLRRREGGGIDLMPCRTPEWAVCRSFCFGNGPVGSFLDESWGWVNLPAGGSWGGWMWLQS